MLDCEDIVKKALGRDMSDQEIQEAFDQFKLLKDKVEADAKAQGLRPDILKASRDWTRQAELAALANKRNSILQLHARSKILNFCLTEFKGMEAEGIEALQVGSQYLRNGSRLSVDERGNALGMSYLGQLLTGLTPGQLALLRSNKLDREIATALFLMEDQAKFTGPPEAMAIAKVIHQVQERARIDANLAGAWIGKLPGYIIRQSHDQAKISRAGFAAWRNEILPRLDWQKTLDGQIDPAKNPQAAEKFLLETWKALADGHHMRVAARNGNPLARDSAIGSEAASMSHDRVLHFKSGADWFEYNAKFGRGGLNEGLVFGLRQSASSTALMQVFGPAPHATLDWVTEKLMDTLQRRGDIKGVTRVRQMRQRFDQNMRILDGSENMDGNITGASVGRFIRSWQSLIKLGGALISSISDIPNVGFEFAYNGQGFFRGMAESLRYFMQGRPSREQQQIAAACGVFFDTMIGGVAARFSDAGTGPKTSAAMNLFFKLNGLGYWTDNWKKSVVLALANHVASLKGQDFTALSAKTRRLFSQYGIGDAEWNLIRKGATAFADGREYLTADAFHTMPSSDIEAYLNTKGRTISEGAISRAREEIASKLRTLYRDRVHYAVLEPDAANRRFMYRGTSSGTVWGEFARYVMQFKSFPTSFVQRTMGREIYGRGADSIGRGLCQFVAKSEAGDRSNFPMMFLAMTGMGILAMQAKALVAGKNTREFFSKDSWYKTTMAGALQGGGLGIIGDFFLADYSRFGTGLLSSFMGPSAGDVDQLARMWSKLKNGDIDLGPDLFRFGMSHFPGSNLFWLKWALDYGITHQVNEWMRPGYIKRMKRRIEKENKQTFWLDPAAGWANK